MSLLDTNYQDQRLTPSQKKKIKPAIQGGGYNYLGEQEEVTVPKKWLSDPDHVVAELAYITPREKKILLDIDLYGSLDGKPNNAPGGLDSLQGDMGTISKSSGGGTGNTTGGNNSNNDSGDAREQYAAKQTSTGFVKGGGNVTFLGGDKNDPSNYTVSDAIVDPEVVQQQKEQYAEQFGGVAPLGSRPVDYATQYEYNQMKYIADSKLDSVKAKLKQAGFTDFDDNASLTEMKDYVKTLNRTGKIGDSWKNAVDKKGNPLYSPETIAKWEASGYVPQSPTLPAPGLFGKVMEAASPSGTLGAPLTYDQLLADFDTITEVGQSQGMSSQERMKTFQPNRYAQMTGMDYNPITKQFTMKTGGNEQDAFTRIASPYELTETVPQESMVSNYFANMNMGGQSPLSSQLETDYNAAKQRVNNLLNITPVSQQFGYSADPYGGLLASNLQTNPFNIEYLRTRGLI